MQTITTKNLSMAYAWSVELTGKACLSWYGRDLKWGFKDLYDLDEAQSAQAHLCSVQFRTIYLCYNIYEGSSSTFYSFSRHVSIPFVDTHILSTGYERQICICYES